MINTSNFKNVYLVGVGYTALVVLLIAVFMEETMYDRDVVPFPERPTTGLRYRVETLIGITGVKMAKCVRAARDLLNLDQPAHPRTRALQVPLFVVGVAHVHLRDCLAAAHALDVALCVQPSFLVRSPPSLALMPLPSCADVGVTFGFGIGINVTQAVFRASCRPSLSHFRPSPQLTLGPLPRSRQPQARRLRLLAVRDGVHVRYAYRRRHPRRVYRPLPQRLGASRLDASCPLLPPFPDQAPFFQIAERQIRRNKGVFEAEMRLWTCYISMPPFVAGFILVGAAFQNKLNVAAVIFGWGLAEFGILINTVAVYNYLNNCFPTRQGETSALINWARVLGGFAVPFYQLPWSEAPSGGPLKVFAMEGAVGAGLFLLIVPFLQVYGSRLRARFSVKH